MEKDQFQPAALPSEIPDPPDLSTVPLSVMHTATVETLISQTEDLTARLKVQIRRNAVLERKSLESEEQVQHIKNELEGLQQQHEIFNEKEIAQEERLRTYKQDLGTAKKELELIEVRYADLSKLKDSQTSELKTKLEKMTEELTQYKELLPLKQKNIVLSDELDQMKKRVMELSQHIQSKEDERASIDKGWTQTKETLAHSQGQLEQLKSQLNEFLNIREEKIELENALILKEREKQQLEQTLQNETVVFKKESQNIRSLAKNLQNEKTQLEVQMKTCEENLNQLTADNKNLETQLDNLQNLWYRLQAEYEKEKTKNMALSKLNKELSHQIQNMRTTPEAQEEYYKRYILKNKDISV